MTNPEPTQPAAPAEPLTAAYCAERCAATLDGINGGDQFGNIAVAEQWLKLAIAMASHPAMSRPKPRDGETPPPHWGAPRFGSAAGATRVPADVELRQF